MVLLMRRQESATTADIDTNKTTREAGPAGAPKVSHVKAVLVALRSRLEIQLGGERNDDPAMARALKDNIRAQLEQINEALAQIEQGKYGVCANCLNPIEADRLVVRPYSTLCLSCQNRKDRGTVR